MDWPRAIVHVDMDTFFVSVERKADPSLIGKPVIVGGGKGGAIKRGVVAACSYETRAFGVHSAMPLAQAIRRCPEAVIVPVGTSDYGVWTRRVREALEGFTDLFEMTSPDEAYVDLEGTRRLHGPPIAAADKLRGRIVEQVELPVSVGLATTRTHAKMASKLSKPGGLFVVFPGGEAAVARPLELRALPGLGPKTAKRLEKFGIATLGQLMDVGEARLQTIVGDHGADLHRRAMGRGSGAISRSRENVQISAEATFGEDVGEADLLDGSLARMTMKVAARLRKSGQWASTVTLKLRYPDFTTLTRQAPLAPPTHDDIAILNAARELFAATWDERRPLRLLGIGVAGLTDSPGEDLFQSTKTDPHERLLETIDAVSKKGGKGKLIWGSALRRGEGEGRHPVRDPGERSKRGRRGA